VLKYLFRRVAISIPLLLGILCLSFGMLKLAPGEPTIVQQDLQTRATGAQRETLRQLYGLDRPVYEQFGRWLWRVVRLDFGRSYSPDGRPVLDKIVERLPITLGLNLLQTLVIFSLAVPLGILSATRQYSRFDKATTVFVFVGFATPDFWLALLLMILFGVQLGWLPISGLRSLNFEYLSFWAQAWDIVSHLILPVLVASVGGYPEGGYFGGLMAVSAVARRIGGLAIDGCIRDSEEIVALGFPIFSRGFCIRGTSKSVPGLVNHPTVFGGIVVQPGDLVLGDDDGLVVVARNEAEAVLEKAVQRVEAEAKKAAQLRSGVSSVELNKLAKVFEALGLVEE